ncbi:MAG: outer-membrane lipoprotein carrier protein LolA, partial [Desulfobacteraceae bacterium]|nr:outer-membrane lipoprotein carrier protein LolA [Desulfobacteraceae bacterium]
GKAPELFSSGKGAGFLSDVRQIRKSFNLESLPAESPKYYRVKLLPHKPTPDLADVIISVAVDSYQIDQVITHNSYGDETRFVLSQYQFNIDPDDALFTFTIPEGVDVVKMDHF